MNSVAESLSWTYSLRLTWCSCPPQILLGLNFEVNRCEVHHFLKWNLSFVNDYHFLNYLSKTWNTPEHIQTKVHIYVIAFMFTTRIWIKFYLWNIIVTKSVVSNKINKQHNIIQNFIIVIWRIQGRLKKRVPGKINVFLW